ncbi:uncharacterized protein [Elaeis guineensis]|uniref:uncharacterized protein isoform X2 n=1 Tax=Elaeis guineensis var. tenera TaxID=51953 RepID=UPI003C6CEE43
MFSYSFLVTPSLWNDKGGKLLAHMSVPSAELTAAQFGIKVAKTKYHASNIILEGDSTTVTNWIRTVNINKHKHLPLLCDISAWKSSSFLFKMLLMFSFPVIDSLMQNHYYFSSLMTAVQSPICMTKVCRIKHMCQEHSEEDLKVEFLYANAGGKKWKHKISKGGERSVQNGVFQGTLINPASNNGWNSYMKLRSYFSLNGSYGFGRKHVQQYWHSLQIDHLATAGVF